MKIFYPIIFILISIMLLGCSPTKSASHKTLKNVNWATSGTLMENIEIGKKEGKPVFLDFYAVWCTPCKMMDKDVYSDPDIYQFFNQNFINYKVDAEKGNGPNLAYLYNIQAYPTLIFLDDNGRALIQHEGALYHSDLKKLAEQALKQYHSGGQ